MNATSSNPIKKPRKPRTKKADMIKKKAELEKIKESQPPKKRGRKPKGGKIIKTELNIHQESIETKMIILLQLILDVNAFLPKGCIVGIQCLFV